MAYVKNRDQLLSHGAVELREDALAIIEHALASSDPYKVARQVVRLEGSVLRAGGFSADLRTGSRIFLLGAGKATYPIAKALEDLLGDRITGGVIVCKEGQEGSLNFCRLFHARHPIPDERGLAASRAALDLAVRTRPGDIVFGCVTGGSSALLPFPVPGITLEDKQKVNRLLLSCGANIVEINAVRKHLSMIKGGRLAQALHPEAHLVNLTVSDVIGDPLDYITDPTVPDTSTFDDALHTLNKYDLWEKIPKSAADHLRNGDKAWETVKEQDLEGRDRLDMVIVKGDAACVAAKEKAEQLGYRTMILSTMLEGESKDLGGIFASVARELVHLHRPLHPPAVVIGGGETTVTISDKNPGEGGPNQEFALAAAGAIEGEEGVVIVGFDSDGTDGPTDTAGGLVDGTTAGRARELGLDLYKGLKQHDVTPVLHVLGDAVLTGATGTNVNDLKFLIAAPDRTPRP